MPIRGGVYPLNERRRRLHGAFVVSVLFAALVAAGWTAPTATGQSDPRDSGLRPANPQSQCAGRYEVWVNGRFHGCSHGEDPPPPGIDHRTRDPIRNPRDGTTSPSTPGATAPGTAAATNSTVCVGDGSSGPRVQAMYVFAGADQSATVVPSIRAWAGDVEAVFNNSAAATGGARHVRFVTDASCRVLVNIVAVSSTDLSDFGKMIAAVEAQGFNRSDRKYLVWADATTYCGIGEIYIDDQPGLGNLNTRGDMFARVDRGCWGVAGQLTEAHELMHTLGGVQLSAPHATSLNHCTDNWDRMCYDDQSGEPPTVICAATALENQFDCNKDDYYYAGTPPAGNYLATHWNTASNPYLSATATPPPPAPPAPTLSVSPTTVAADGSVTAAWSNVPAAQSDWVGLYKAGASDSPIGVYQFTGAKASGSMAFKIPANTTAGTYELRLFSDGTYNRLAVSGPFTVTGPAPPTLSVSPGTVAAGGSVTATWSGVPAAQSDWIGLYKAGAADNPIGVYQFTGATASGSMAFKIPANTTLGTYSLRLFSDGTYNRLAVSGPFSVQ